MAFNAAQYQATVTKIDSGLDSLTTKLNQLVDKAKSVARKWFVPGPVGKALVWCVNKMVSLGKWVIGKISELLKGAAIPITAFKYGVTWQTDVRGPATDVVGNVTTDALQAPKNWKGDGATAYTSATKMQPTAATQIATMADKVVTAMSACAVAGLAFYVSLGVILVKLIVATVAAIAASATVVFSWAGILSIVTAAKIEAGLIITTVSLLVAALGLQGQQLTTVKGEAVDNRAFPRGKWPVATA
ncbi:hypothetical protein [Streptomyces sp. I05A-00742]|uniref:hypothetical protein n=1 Tax=Streptomyces sp. I05A-00742 TaxID=2732853 RepID=UPI00148884B2|nr:hypothetical protein [Streptomyces sp. I05A-00742]